MSMDGMTRSEKLMQKLVRLADEHRRYRTKIMPADEAGLSAAEKLLSAGNVVAVATETVYGLAASAFHEGGVRRIFTAKGRPQTNPLIVHVSNTGMVYPLISEIPKGFRELAERFWPGPLTIVMKKSGLIPGVVTAGLDTAAIRMPSHPAVRALIDKCGYPLAAPSANSSGAPSPTCARHVFDDLKGKIPLILDSGCCGVGVESTVVSLAGEKAMLLRPGAITLEQLREVLGEVDIAAGVNEPPAPGSRPLSPGMSFRHYSPKAKVVLLVGGAESFLRYISEHPVEGGFALCFDSEGERAGIPFVSLGKKEDSAEAQRNVFAALRGADDRGAAHIYARCPAKDGEWLALFNRLQRSAGFEVICLE